MCGRSEGNGVEGTIGGRWGLAVESGSCPAFARCSRRRRWGRRRTGAGWRCGGPWRQAVQIGQRGTMWGAVSGRLWAVAGLASGPPVDDDTEVHKAATAAPSGGAQRLEQRSVARGRAEWMARARWLLQGRGEGKRGFASEPRRAVDSWQVAVAFFYFQNFETPKFEIQNGDLPYV
jgi:hypothetical protein